jgi:hypothetical protein
MQEVSATVPDRRVDSSDPTTVPCTLLDRKASFVLPVELRRLDFVAI